MTVPIRRQLLGGVVAFVLSSSALGAAQGQQPPWWRSHEIVKELGLSADQSARIDKIFRTTRPELRQEFEELDRLEAKLSRLIEGDTTDEAELIRQIDRVETARASASKTRSLMLWRMRQVLTPEQRERLRTLQERSDRGRRQGAPDDRREGPGEAKPAPESHKQPGF